jgi:hypothetical protein
MSEAISGDQRGPDLVLYFVVAGLDPAIHVFLV